jgi:DNA-binding LytR/AlgR family response regulator
MKIRCIIVEDEPLARKGIEENIRDLDYLELVGIAENAVQAGMIFAEQDIDLMFLDINMPKISGLEFLKNLKQRPIVIIISAYSEYALQGFELDVLDYLLKPVTSMRFLKAVEKAREFYELNHRANQLFHATHFFIKADNKFEKIAFDEICFIEAADNYVFIQTLERKFMTYVTIKIVEDKLPKLDFIKVHKSFIVSIDKIKSIEGTEVVVGNHKVPISRGLKDSVMEALVNKNLLKR